MNCLHPREGGQRECFPFIAQEPWKLQEGLRSKASLVSSPRELTVWHDCKDYLVFCVKGGSSLPEGELSEPGPGPLLQHILPLLASD